MQITISGSAKEIAAFVLEIQEQQEGKGLSGQGRTADFPADDIADKLRELAAKRKAQAEQAMRDIPWRLQLYVRDRDNGETHLVGSDPHDRLWVNADGLVQYENLQNGCGTLCGFSGLRGTYEFTPSPDGL